MNLRPSAIALALLPLRALELSAVSASVSCTTCAARQTCLPKGLENEALARLSDIVGERLRVAEGDTLYADGAPFHQLYAVRLGQFKTVRGNQLGREQIMGFHMSGDLLALDAVGGDRHLGSAVALEYSEVCEIPIAPLEHLLGTSPVLMRHFHRIMSREILRDQHLIVLLGSMPAEQRVAVFLVNLSILCAARGYSATTLRLRMSREEIGNYLCMSVESVSRMLLRLKQRGWIDIDVRSIVVREPAQMAQYASNRR